MTLAQALLSRMRQLRDTDDRRCTHGSLATTYQPISAPAMAPAPPAVTVTCVRRSWQSVPLHMFEAMMPAKAPTAPPITAPQIVCRCCALAPAAGALSRAQWTRQSRGVPPRHAGSERIPSHIESLLCTVRARAAIEMGSCAAAASTRSANRMKQMKKRRMPSRVEVEPRIAHESGRAVCATQ